MAQPSVSSPVDLTSILDSGEEDSDAEYQTTNSNVNSCHQAAPQTAPPSEQNEHQLPFNVMLTCYTLFERDSMDQQADRSFLRKWQWSHLLLDEAHAVKNAGAMRTKRLTRCHTNLMCCCCLCYGRMPNMILSLCCQDIDRYLSCRPELGT